jgi:hypothetical protein
MNQSTIQPPTPAIIPPTDQTVTASRVGLQYVTINADTTKEGGDWIANVGLSTRYGMVGCETEFWQFYRLKGGCHLTTDLIADEFYRVRLASQHFGLYIDSSGGINCFTKKAFERELDRRFRDCVKDVNLECDGDWAGDPFSNCIPEANLGESRSWLDPH